MELAFDRASLTWATATVVAASAFLTARQASVRRSLPRDAVH